MFDERRAGSFIRSAGREALAAGSECLSDSGRDIKLKADMELHEKLSLFLTDFTGLSVLSEEGEQPDYTSVQGSFWILDPLDGSYNFHRGLPHAAVSVSLWKGGAPQVSYVYDIFRDTLYYAGTGGGCFADGGKIHCSDADSACQAAVASGFSVYRDYSDEEMLKDIAFLRRFKKIRFIGSAALSLAYVAEGRLDAYFETDIGIWDVAAGLGLVKAAGGTYRLEKGSAPNKVTVLAHNGRLGL
ncbi:inositol monophosphatase family protein [Geovibrio thiophilus]|uniref:Inositol monophosphatase family protein n=1 Tax=Geovibrio thiophilus TaxID=139438 RepID=A0A410JV98_9BACT|nr:inositol monophosphatase family protein [Geovibrio thiophilus]QAR32102.1 inositol monophosphatase family protein [Geovibrio thiophilus]